MGLSLYSFIKKKYNIIKWRAYGKSNQNRRQYKVTIKDGNIERDFLTSEFVEYPRIGDEVKVIVNGTNNIIKKEILEEHKIKEETNHKELIMESHKNEINNKKISNFEAKRNQPNNIGSKIIYDLLSLAIPILGFYWFLKFKNNIPEIAIITFVCSIISLIIIFSNFYKNSKDIVNDVELDEYNKICYEYCTKDQNYDTGSYSSFLNSCVCK